MVNNLAYMTGVIAISAIMVILVFYCVRNINLTQYPYGMAEIISSIAVILTQMWRKNMYLAIIVGTVCYMILIRTVF